MKQGPAWQECVDEILINYCVIATDFNENACASYSFHFFVRSPKAYFPQIN